MRFEKIKSYVGSVLIALGSWLAGIGLRLIGASMLIVRTKEQRERNEAARRELKLFVERVNGVPLAPRTGCNCPACTASRDQFRSSDGTDACPIARCQGA